MDPSNALSLNAFSLFATTNGVLIAKMLANKLSKAWRYRPHGGCKTGYPNSAQNGSVLSGKSFCLCNLYYIYHFDYFPLAIFIMICL